MAYRVVKSGNEYGVKQDGAKRASKTFNSREEAQDYADSLNGVSKATKAVKKISKKTKGNPILIILILVLIVGLAVGGYFLYKNGAFDSLLKKQEKEPRKSSVTLEGVIYDDFQIHFMTLGNDKAGDSVYIKAGDVDIVIDAGSRQESVTTTEAYIDQYCKDNKLEYVILTHGDQDHIEGFTDTNARKGLLSYYQVDTIIDPKFTTKSTNVYNNYVALRDSLVAKGTTKHYTADQCWNNEAGAQRTYQLSDKVKMDILYNKYYFEKGYTGTTAPSGWENNYSVCTLFTYTYNSESHYFLLTGDLEKEGEESLAAYYDGSTPEKTLPKVDLFKAGHHGSKTSSNDCLLDIIQPQICVVSCCCGTDEYTGNTDNQFPTQAFIDRISKWTDAVYVTSTYESYEIITTSDSNKKTGVTVGNQYVHTSGWKPMNGNICVSIGTENQIGLSFSNNSTKLKDSDWIKTEITLDGVKRTIRTMPNNWK